MGQVPSQANDSFLQTVSLSLDNETVFDGLAKLSGMIQLSFSVERELRYCGTARGFGKTNKRITDRVGLWRVALVTESIGGEKSAYHKLSQPEVTMALFEPPTPMLR